MPICGHAFLPSRLNSLNWAALHRAARSFGRRCVSGTAEHCNRALRGPNRTSRRADGPARAFAVVLLSGGLDSMVAAALRARGRLRAARAHRRLQPAPPDRARGRRAGSPPRSAPSGISCCRSICAAFGGSALTADIDVPKGGVGDDDPGHLRAGAQHHLPVARARLGRGGGRARPVHRRQRARLFRLSRLPARFHRRLRAARRARHQGGGRGRRFTGPRAAARHEQGRHRPRGGAARARRRPELVLLRSDARRPALRPVRQLPAARRRASRRPALPIRPPMRQRP